MADHKERAQKLSEMVCPHEGWRDGWSRMAVNCNTCLEAQFREVEREAFPRCETCGGDGERCYASTSTWRGGIGGQTITASVCDRCWGTGRSDRKGPDLRALASQFDERVRREVDKRLARLVKAADALRDALGIERESHERWEFPSCSMNRIYGCSACGPDEDFPCRRSIAIDAALAAYDAESKGIPR